MFSGHHIISYKSLKHYIEGNDIFQLESGNSTDIDDIEDIPDYTVDEIQMHTDLTVEHNNGTAKPIWRRYLEGVFNISNVSLDFENDKVMVSDEDLKYMAKMAAYVAKTPPVVLELYIWVKVRIITTINANVVLFVYYSLTPNCKTDHHEILHAQYIKNA